MIYDSMANMTYAWHQYLFLKPTLNRPSIPTRIYQPATIARLPPEILSILFLFYVQAPQPRSGNSKPRLCYSLETQASPLVLTQVCSSWRRAAFSTNQMWSSLHVTGPTPGQIPLIQLWLKLSSQAPLSLSFKQQPPILHQEPDHSINVGDPLVLEPLVKEVLYLFAQHSSRWKEINLQFSFPDTPLYTPISLCDPLLDLSSRGGLPRLESASINIFVEEVWSCAYASDVLRSIHVHQGLGLHRQAPWSRLTALRCDGIAEYHFMFIAANCISLQSLQVEFYIYPRDSEEEARWSSPVPNTLKSTTLPSLRTLTISFNCIPPHSVFDCLKLPSLRSLTLHQELELHDAVPDGILCDSFRNMLVRSSCALEELRIPDYLVNYSMIFGLGTLFCLRSLSVLELGKVEDDVLSLLTLPNYTFFPDLCHLKIPFCSTKGDTLAKMLKSRMRKLKEVEIVLGEGSKIDLIPLEIWFYGPKIRIYDAYGLCIRTKQPRTSECLYCGASYVPRRQFHGVFAAT